jgi:protein tyrosine phosphatase (PTP) superfamily phosphohydrolase (DUF442 family)
MEVRLSPGGAAPATSRREVQEVMGNYPGLQFKVNSTYGPRGRSPRSATRGFAGRLAAAAVVLLSFATVAAAQSAAEYPELPRFSRAAERLYRGGQPRPGGVARLAELGVDTIVNLRGPGERVREDEEEARALGLRYFHVPMPTWGRPESEQVQRALEIIASPENGSVFIHCKDGVDRTGTIVAVYRIAYEGWDADDAVAEARRHGMRATQVWMRGFIRDFAEHRRRAADPLSAADDEGEDEVEDDGLGARMGTYVRVGESGVTQGVKAVWRVGRRAPAAVLDVVSSPF